MAGKNERQAGFVFINEEAGAQADRGADLGQAARQRQAAPSWAQHSTCFSAGAKPSWTTRQMVLSKSVLFRSRLTGEGEFRVSRIVASALVFLVHPFHGGSWETTPQNISGFRCQFCSKPLEGSAGQAALLLSQGSQGHWSCW